MVGARPIRLLEPELVPESISHHPQREKGVIEGQDPSPRWHGKHPQRCPLLRGALLAALGRQVG